jgi:mediator of RNA polymerase II transcription subunit 13
LVPSAEARTGPEAGFSIPVATEQSLKLEIASFDSYDMDSTWSRPKDAYLDIDMNDMDFVMNDIGLDFNLDMGPMANPSSTGAAVTPFNTTTATASIEDAFTDDDFNFFDQPSRPNPPLRQFASSHAGSVVEPSTLSSTAFPGTAIGTRILPPNCRNLSDTHVMYSTTQLHTPGAFMDDFTPRSIFDHIESGLPGLLPSSPGPMPESHSVPCTPTVHLEFDLSPKRPGAITEGLSRSNAGLFEPIPFAAYHREVDDKYVVGKFALPSPPPETSWADGACISMPASPSRFGSNGGWRFEYNAATDPRIGLVKKLIGVKRKMPSMSSKSQMPPSKKAFCVIADEDWSHGEAATQENEESDADSIEDDAEESGPSRPTTPPPSYLPEGPTLLSSHFQHSHLLSLSVPLHPPGAAICPLNLASTNNPTPSVPTPVSPAAMMGAASERSRSLEAAASAVAVEIVENPLWAESWKASSIGVGSVGGVWSTDIKAVHTLLESIPGLEAPLTVAELFGLADTVADSKVMTAESTSSLQPMEAPMISIGKGEAVIQVLPPALRFWEKLGLTPKGGRKNVAAFVMFEENARKQHFMEKWLMGFRSAYQVRRMIHSDEHN